MVIDVRKLNSTVTDTVGRTIDNKL